MARLNVCLFGKLSLQWNGRSLPGFDGRKPQQLLSYLLLHRDHPQPREVLADLLWGDYSTEQAKKYLRQALWQLQSALVRNHQPTNSCLLTVDTEWVDLHSGADLWLDVAVFEEAFSLVQNIEGHDLDLEKAQLLERAAQLYQGDLLKGWYESWCLFERERLQNMYLAMLDKLMGYSESNRQYETGIVHGTRILFFDRAREHTHQHLMLLQYLAGNRTAALRQYERCSAALNEELGVKPARSTQSLYEQIRDDRVAHPAVIPINMPHSLTLPAVPALESLSHLKKVGELLAEVQDAVQHGLQELELMMKGRR